jgi:hypothetical protein
MGLGTTSGNITYLSITDGKIAQRLKEPREGSVTVVNSKGASRQEMQFRDVSGYIKDIKVREHDYGKEWQIYLEDGGQTFCLSFPYSSRYANGFLMAIQNINLNKKVVFSPWMKVVDNVKKTNLYLKHEGDEKSIEWFYSKDNPKGLPEMKQLKVKGQVVWDDTDKMEFLQKMIDSVIIPKLKSTQDVLVNKEEKGGKVYLTETLGDDDSSLPF